MYKQLTITAIFYNLLLI